MTYKCDECGKTCEEKEDCCGVEMKEEVKEEDLEDIEEKGI